MHQERHTLTDDTLRNLPENAMLVGADQRSFGPVIGTRGQYLLVERGFFFPIDYYIPLAALDRVIGDRVVLRLTRDDALDQGWERPPAEIMDSEPRAPATDQEEPSIDDGQPAPPLTRHAAFGETYAVGTNTDSYGVIDEATLAETSSPPNHDQPPAPASDQPPEPQAGSKTPDASDTDPHDGLAPERR